MADVTTIGEIVQRLGFADILLWLLTFAVVFGVMSQAMPKMRKEVVAIIAMVLGFLVIIAVPSALITFISKMSSYLILLVLGILVLVIFFETLGVKEKYYKIEGGKHVGEREKSIISHPAAVIALLIIVVLIFIGAGGLELAGIKIPYGFDITGVIFFAALIGAVLWMIKGKENEKD